MFPTNHGDHEPGPVAGKPRVFKIGGGGARVMLNVRQMEKAPLTDGPGRVDLGAKRHRVLAMEPLEPFGPYAMGRGEANHAAIDDEDHAPEGVTDVDAASGDRLEDWLDVCRGASDHAEDLTSCSLPLERAAHLCMCLRQR